MNWKATVGRVSIFPTVVGGGRSAQADYSAVFKQDPTAYNANIVGGISNAQGQYDGFSAVCSIQPLRIDFTLTAPQPEGQPVPSGLPLIEDPAQLKSGLQRIIGSIVAGAIEIPAARVAVFLQLTKLVKDIREGNEVISQTLPPGYVLPLHRESDVILQINQPQDSAVVPNLRLNFVTRWSLDNMKVLTLPIGAPGGETLAAPATIAPFLTDFTAVNIVFDNNTVPRETPLGKEESSKGLQELLEGIPTKSGIPVKFGDS
jgi:hypothetical protein